MSGTGRGAVCKNKRMCAECGKRKALYRVRGKGKMHCGKEHDLCEQCWQSACQSMGILGT